MADSHITISIQVQAPNGTAELQCRVGQNPARLSSLVVLAQALTDQLAAQALTHAAKQGQPVSCGPGCGVCCSQLLGVSAAEAFALADMVAALDEPHRDRVMGRFDAAVDMLNHKGWDARLRELMQGFAEIDLSAMAADYFRLQISCPLLVDASCEFHPHRPLACREYNVTTPSAWCVDRERHQVRTIPMPRSLSQTLAAVAAELSGSPATLVPLTHALQYAEENAEFAFHSWPAKDLVHLFVQKLSS